METLENLKLLCDLAVKLGTTDAKVITTNQVVVNHWVRWKCRFGCPSYNTSLMCPPYSPTPDETRALLQEYEYAILFSFKSSTSRNIAAEIERQVFLQGYHAAFALTFGSCHFCDTCNLEAGYCRHPQETRPSMESCGINVFATAANAGYSLTVKTSRDEEYVRFGLLLVA
jgi:predicted metal-binding protein